MIVRGRYGTVPMPEGEGDGQLRRVENNSAGGAKLGAHVDGLACNLGCVGYIADVPPDSGGFAIYPGSHRRMHRCFDNAFAVTTNSTYLLRPRRIHTPLLQYHTRTE